MVRISPRLSVMTTRILVLLTFFFAGSCAARPCAYAATALSSLPAFAVVRRTTSFITIGATTSTANVNSRQNRKSPPLAAVSGGSGSGSGSGGGGREERILRGDGGVGLPASKSGGDVSSTSTSRLKQLPAVSSSTSTSISSSSSSSGADSGKETKSPHLKAYWEILRPQNIPSSFGLVAAGALVASHSPSSLLDPKVVLTAIAAASVAVGSCVLNDWFDIELDRVNEPNRPLVTGEVVPSHALGIGVALLLGAIASASAVHPAALQATIVASVALTFVYTPILKPIPLVKNAIVAGVIAAAIAAGGLAAGAGLAPTLTPSVLTFFVIAHREILMDIADVDGDRKGGVRTLPVLLGCPAALAFATALLTAGIFGAGAGILSGTTESTQPAAVALSTLFVLPLYANIYRVASSKFSKEQLDTAIDQALGPLALVLGLMGVVLHA